MLTTAATEDDIQREYLRSQARINREYGLTPHEKKMFRNPGYEFINCDTSCLYKIIRNFSRVHRPTQGWGRQVINYNNYGDLVEKLREIRNAIVHRANVRFSRTEMHFIKVNIRKIIVAICSIENNDDLRIDLQRYMF